MANKEKVTLIYEIKEIGKKVLTNLAKNMDQAKVKARKLESQLKSVSKIGKGLAVGAGAVATALGVMGIKALKAAGELEKQATALEVLTGSAESAKDLLEEINAVAIATPFEQKDIINATSSLMAFGVAQKDVIPTFKILGDISQGNAEKLKSLTRAYGKVQAKGKSSMEEIQMVAEAGVPIIQALADTLGKTKEEVFELSSQGKISSDIFNKAMKSMTVKGGIFFNSMTKQSKTMGGLWSTFQGNVSLVAQAFGNELLPHAKKVISYFNGILTKLINLSPVMKRNIVIIGAVAFAFATLLTGLGAFLAIAPAVAAGWALVGGAISAAIWPVTLGVAAVAALILAFTKFKVLQPILAGLTIAFGTFWAVATGGLLPLIAGVASLIGWILKLTGVFDGLDKKLSKTNAKITETKEALAEATKAGDEDEVAKLEEKLKKMQAKRDEYAQKKKDKEAKKEAVKKEKAEAGGGGLGGVAAEEDAKTALLLEKEKERAEALKEQEAVRREEKAALDEELQAAEDEADVAKFEEAFEKLLERDMLTEAQEAGHSAKLQEIKHKEMVKGFKQWLGIQKSTELQKQSTAQKLATWDSFMANSSTSKNKEVAAIGKAIAIKDIAIRTKQAAMAGLQTGLSAGFPVGIVLGPVLAAAALAYGAEQIAGVSALADGGSMIVDSPTMIGNNVLAGEAGPERIDVTPTDEGGGAGGNITNNIILDGEVIATSVLKRGQEMRNEGTLDDGLGGL